MTKSTSLNDFLETARREFGFLVSEFGFTEHPHERTYPNPFCICYMSLGTTVTIEGTQWGFGVQVMLSVPSGQPAIPLWAIAESRAIPHGFVSGQLAQLTHAASLLRICATDILRGDFSSFPAAMHIVEHHTAESAKPKQRKLP